MYRASAADKTILVPFLALLPSHGAFRRRGDTATLSLSAMLRRRPMVS